MSEALYFTTEGPLGTAEVYQVTPQDKPGQVQWEVQFKGERHKCSAEGEAVIVAMELAGTPDESLARPATA